MLALCWSHRTTKNDTTTTTTTTIQNTINQNGDHKLTNHSNNLLIISSYNGSAGKVSEYLLNENSLAG